MKEQNILRIQQKSLGPDHIFSMMNVVILHKLTKASVAEQLLVKSEDGGEIPRSSIVNEQIGYPLMICKRRRSRVQGEDRDAWRHDRYFEMEADPKPLPRKSSFREKKISDDSEKADKAIEEPLKTNANKDPVLENEKKEDRGNNSRHLERSERAFAGDRGANWGEAWRGNYSSRDRCSSRGGNYRGRERFTARQGYNPTDGGAEKWKHDLFDEANRSPTPKNEDVVAKVEALLAS